MTNSDTFTADCVTTITSYDNATPGSGTALNQCALTYNSFSQLTEEQQDHGGTVSGSSPKVQHSYDLGASGSNEIRLNGLTYPNSRTLTYRYGTSGGMNDLLNRVDTIQDTTSGTTSLASYTYLGLGTVIRITYPQPSVWLDLWGGTSGTFNGLDLFNRIIDQRWQNGITGTPADIDRYQYGYDQDSNRFYKANVVGTPIVSGGLDEYYTYDHLNRLTDMQRGTLNSGKTGIAGTPSVEQTWTLDPTGNWPGFVTQASGTTNLNQSRTSNKVNEITALSESTGPTWIAPAYDAAGNTTTMPQVASPASSFTAVYDAWNRMATLSSSGSTIATYSYDGQNRRIVKVTAAISETRHFYFSSQWQDVEERVATSTSMDKQYVWGLRYIDELVCCDDATPERLYVCQDANFNLTAITDTSGAVQERYLFDPYGNRTILNTAWGIIGASSYDWVIGFQGLIHDEESGLVYVRYRYLNTILGKWLSWDRFGQLAMIGMSAIPANAVAFLSMNEDAATLTYIDGMNLYQFVDSNPSGNYDPSGLGPVPNFGTKGNASMGGIIANSPVQGAYAYCGCGAKIPGVPLGAEGGLGFYAGDDGIGIAPEGYIYGGPGPIGGYGGWGWPGQGAGYGPVFGWEPFEGFYDQRNNQTYIGLGGGEVFPIIGAGVCLSGNYAPPAPPRPPPPPRRNRPGGIFWGK